MFKKVFFSAVFVFFSIGASAQEFGALVGVHQTTADVESTSTDGKFNFKLGLAMAFDLMEGSKFRTGAIYNQRHFEAGGQLDVKFDWIDIPALYQHSFTEMVSVFGGLTVAVNVSDKTEPTINDLDVETLIPLIDVGINLMFDDMMGFDFYYQRGLGDIAESTKDYSTFGANFLYWF